ncbi:hypothetical protein MIND_00869000 [Mycena indigotica]|uniref:Uncharacterized protein n=1 Tax=Mycena indigotica TaxID=2126181 RepID=A0A8H6SGM5_9AGAR|nr:uncharacterized protein MIND_00869000 [Mycena indigotica]KAF7299203.1 hypothetical protein MIND_00869000 [Mycena indigotica]
MSLSLTWNHLVLLGYFHKSPHCRISIQMTRVDDHVVRRKFQHMLQPTFQPFPFTSLAVELVMQILGYAVTTGQSTYRALLLTNRQIYDWIRLEMLPKVAVVLKSKEQLQAFDYYLDKRGAQVIPRIRALWTICPGSGHDISTLGVSIIQRCIHIRSLACPPYILQRLLSGRTLKHKECVSLTLFQYRAYWAGSMTDTAFKAFMNQLEHLYFIGALEQNHWSPNSIVPKLDKVKRISIAIGSDPQLRPEALVNLLESPKLQQVVVTSHLHSDEHSSLVTQASTIDHRIMIMHRRRRWKEHNIWQDGIHDPDCFWKQAAAEKDLPPPALHSNYFPPST